MKRRWTDLPVAARYGVVALLLVAVIVVLSVMSRLGTSADDPPAASPTSAPTPEGEPTGSPSPPTGEPISTMSPEPTRNPDAEPLRELPRTNDPDEYAAAIARIVLGSNPRDHARDDYLDVLFGEIRGEVSDDDRARIEPVIESWFPDKFQWERQRDYAQVHTFTAESVWVPQIAEDNADEIPDEYQMRTVAGTQKTKFLDENNDVETSTTPRLITVIAYCPRSPRSACSLFSIPQEVER